MQEINVAIVGATGVVGGTLLEILEQRHFPVHNLYLLASKRSAGEVCHFKKKPYLVTHLAEFDFKQTTISFFCVSNNIAAEYAPIAAALGNVVIDKSSFFRYDPYVPLIVPEVNEAAIPQFYQKNIIASPNCSTIPIAMILKPLYDAVGITRINVATYQSVSGTGKEAIAELSEQTSQLLNGRPIKPKVYTDPIAFNVIPHIDEFQQNGYTKEEMKIIWELHKIFNDDTIAINPTAVRVPVFYGHSSALHIETNRKITLKDAIKLLENAPGIKVNTGKHPYATPAADAAGKDMVFVGRIREDISHENGLNCWVVSDNLRKGAALNAVQIAEIVVKRYL